MQPLDSPVMSRRGVRASTTWLMLTRCLGFLWRQFSARAAARCAALIEYLPSSAGSMIRKSRRLWHTSEKGDIISIVMVASRKVPQSWRWCLVERAYIAHCAMHRKTIAGKPLLPLLLLLHYCSYYIAHHSMGIPLAMQLAPTL